MSKKRVLFFSQAPGVGGGELATLPVLRRLDGIDLVAVAPGPVAAYAEGLGVRAITLELTRANRLTHALRIATGSLRVQKLARDLSADLLYANGTRAIPYAIGATLAGSRPLLFHHHGLLEHGAVRAFSRAVDRWADAIVAPSNTAAAPIRATDKLHVVANGIDLSHFRPPADRGENKRALGIAPETTVVGTLTRPDPTKGMSEFVDMAQRVAESLPDVHFVLAGGPIFPHERDPYLTVAKRAKKLGSRMTITGTVGDPAAVYQAMDVFVHLGGPEGFGLTVAEALACGVPVVSYDWGAIPEVFDGLVTLAPPHHLDAVATHIARLVSDPGLRSDWARRGRRAAEERFGIDRTVVEIQRIVESLLTRADRHPKDQ